MKEGLSKFLLKKKIFSLILVASIIFGMLPATVSAAPALGVEITDYTEAESDIPPSLEPGEVWTDKSVTYDGDGVFNITLSAAGRDYEITTPTVEQSVDVVLVLDVSGSMDGSSKLGSMKTAAESAVRTLLAPELDNRVALVSYSNTATKKVDFTEDLGTKGHWSGWFGKTWNKGSGLVGEIEDLKADGGTNIQNAFLVAQNAITGRSNKDRKPVIILMSDGAPTYYHTSLTDHKDSNREGTRGATTGTHVWWTIQQAMEAKEKITNLDIYTIGFGVGDDELAKATLKPTVDNKPYTYSGETRTDTKVVEYTRKVFGDWEQSGDPVISEGVWGQYSDIRFEAPQDTEWKKVSETGGGWFDTTKTITYTKTRYQGIIPQPYNHEYYEPLSTTTSTDPSAILAAFMSIAGQLTSAKPINKTGDDYNDVIITDVIGDQFEAVGDLPSGVVLDAVNNTAKWTLNGNEFKTIPHDDPDDGALTPDSDYINKVSFKVKIKDGTGVGTYNTNVSAKAEFKVPTNNPFEYDDEDDEIEVALNNTGSLTLAAIPNTDATITITKFVSGPVPDDKKTPLPLMFMLLK